MPIFVETPFESKDNKFISNMYRYRRLLFRAEELIRRPDADVASLEIPKSYSESLQHYEMALDYAINLAKGKDETEKQIAITWLEGNKFTILDVFHDFAKRLKPFYEVEVLDKIEGKGYDYGVEIDNLIEANRYINSQDPIEPSAEFKIKLGELDHAGGIVQKRLDKAEVRNIYIAKFLELIRDIERINLFSWYNEHHGLIEEHRRRVVEIITQYGTLEQHEEFSKSSDILDRFLRFHRNRKCCLEGIHKLVNISIEYRAQWEESSHLRKLYEELKGIGTALEKRMRKAVSSLTEPSFWRNLRGYLKDFAYLITSPVGVPLALAYAGITKACTGEADWSYFGNLRRIAENCLESMVKHPFTTLCFAVGLISSFVLPPVLGLVGYAGLYATGIYLTGYEIEHVTRAQIAYHDEKRRHIKYCKAQELRRIDIKCKIETKQNEITQFLTNNTRRDQEEQKKGEKQKREYLEAKRKAREEAKDIIPFGEVEEKKNLTHDLKERGTELYDQMSSIEMDQALDELKGHQNHIQKQIEENNYKTNALKAEHKKVFKNFTLHNKEEYQIALEKALLKGNLKNLLEKLVELHINLNFVNEKKKSLLDLAIQIKDKSLRNRSVILLLKNGCRVCEKITRNQVIEICKKFLSFQDDTNLEIIIKDFSEKENNIKTTEKKLLEESVGLTPLETQKLEKSIQGSSSFASVSSFSRESEFEVGKIRENK